MTTVESCKSIVEPMDARRVGWSDVGLTALLVGAGLLGTGGAAANQGQTAPIASYVLMVAACLPIAISRWRPGWAAALSGAATVAYLGLGYAYGPIVFAMIVATYRLAVGMPVRRAVVGTAALLVACLAAVAARSEARLPHWSDLIAAAACVGLTAAVGAAVKVRRDAAADVRAAQVHRAISEERLWLAQEVHDAVGHGLAVIAMQAGVALRVLDRDPAEARQALEAIRETSRHALDGVRADLAALRQPKRPGPPRPDSPLRPNTGLADLPALAKRIRSSGLPVKVEVADTITAGGLPADVDRSAYLIVQESLTNVLRHGGPDTTARVRIQVDAGALCLEVIDTGHDGTPKQSEPSADGQGIDGMRARAEALGGSLEAGSRPDGGFAVRAWLPIAHRGAMPIAMPVEFMEEHA